MGQIGDWVTSSAISPSQVGGRTKTKTGWSAQTVKNILTNPAVIGRIQVNGHTVHRAQPLISAEDFQRIKDTLTARGKRRIHAYDTALLTSILICKNGH